MILLNSEVLFHNKWMHNANGRLCRALIKIVFASVHIHSIYLAATKSNACSFTKLWKIFFLLPSTHFYLHSPCSPRSLIRRFVLQHIWHCVFYATLSGASRSYFDHVFAIYAKSSVLIYFIIIYMYSVIFLLADFRYIRRNSCVRK